MKSLLILSSILIFGISCANNSKLKDHYKLYKAVHSDERTEKNISRDVYRHPVKTLKFFGIKPRMKVVEISPGAGWYSEILGPYLKNGELVFTIFSDESKKPYAPKLNKKIRELTSNKDMFGKVNFVTVETPNYIDDIAPENSLDMALTFRNVHNWMKDNKAKEVFSKVFKALKPGGILGVVEHRASLDKKQDPRSKTGYVREDYLIDLVESLGFEFVAKSEINANYNDTKDHPKGVWTLPPRLSLKNKNRSKYLAIGESDRMTVKFRKPLN